MEIFITKVYIKCLSLKLSKTSPEIENKTVAGFCFGGRNISTSPDVPSQSSSVGLNCNKLLNMHLACMRYIYYIVYIVLYTIVSSIERGMRATGARLGIFILVAFANFKIDKQFFISIYSRAAVSGSHTHTLAPKSKHTHTESLSPQLDT